MKSRFYAVVGLVGLAFLAPSCSNPTWTLEPAAPDNGSGAGTGLFTIASGQNNPGAVVSDGTNVYWVNQGSPPDYADGAVMKVSVTGGEATTLASGQSGPSAIAVDATSVYWVMAGPIDGAVVKVSLGGGKITTLASGQSLPTGIAVDATSVYWTNQYAGIYDGDETCNGQALKGTFIRGTVMRVPLSGGTVTTLANEQCAPAGIAVDSSNVYWTNTDYCGAATVNNPCPDAPLGSAGNPDPIDPGNTVMSVPIGGGALTTLASNQNGLWPIAVGAASVYWTSPDNLAVMSVPIGSGAPTVLVAEQYYPWDVVVDATHAYWVNVDDADNGSVIMSVPLDGSGAPSAIAAGQSASYLAVDAQSVYWTNQGKDGADGTVMRLTPK